MSRKVIIDCDPGIDDAVALAMALFDPQLDVVAVTATAGNVPADQAGRNVQAIVEQLDPPRYPRIGFPAPADGAAPVGARHLHGDDGLGNAGIRVSQHQHQHPAEKVICDEIRAAPYEVSLVCLGPLTNVAVALQREPQIASMLDRIIVCGGTYQAPGNVTPAAEFNMYFHPAAARAVLRSPTTRLLVPLDITAQVRFPMALLDKLPDESSRVGRLLRSILPFLYRAYHHHLGEESVLLPGAIAVLAASQIERFQTLELPVDVEVEGHLCAGATIFDRRPKPEWRDVIEVAVDGNLSELAQCVVDSLVAAGAIR